MVDIIDRRMVLAMGAESILSSCSRMGYSVHLTAEPSAVARVLEVVRSFAAQHNYESEDVASRGPSDLFYRGRWSIFWFYRQSHMPEESFMAEFRHRDEIWFPRDDLETWLKEFVATIQQIEGVFVPAGYE